MTQKRELAIEMGKRLKELRNIKGKTQKEVASNLGLKQSVLSSYENGYREPPVSTLNSIAQYYDVTVDFLTCNTDIKSPIHMELYPLLNDKAISVLKSLDDESIQIVNKLITCKGFSYLLRILYEYLSFFNGVKSK